MRIGYARVSTSDQNIELQLHALKAAGCDRIHTDQGVSGASRFRPGLTHSIDDLKPGDTLVIWRLDRLGRSLSHLIDVVSELGRRQIGLYSITEAIDTGSAGGILIFHIMGALAEFERALISERTRAGMSAARMRGSAIGRPRKLSSSEIERLADAIEKGGTIKAAARDLGVSRATLYRALWRRSRNKYPGDHICEQPESGNRAPGMAEASSPITWPLVLAEASQRIKAGLESHAGIALAEVEQEYRRPLPSVRPPLTGRAWKPRRLTGRTRPSPRPGTAHRRLFAVRQPIR
jgi:Site-specific recombinases, DNA invertase Pin homologs